MVAGAIFLFFGFVFVFAAATGGRAEVIQTGRLSDWFIVFAIGFCGICLIVLSIELFREAW